MEKIKAFVISFVATFFGFSSAFAQNPPVASNDAFSTIEDMSVSGNVLFNDSDPDFDALSVITFVVTGDATVYNAGNQASIPGGIGTIAINANGEFTFLPAQNYNNNTAVTIATYTISDGTTNATATLSIQVSPVNDPPVAYNQAISIAKNTIGEIVLSGDDSDGDELTYILTAPPSHGDLSGAGSILNYTPDLNYTGLDDFTFRVYDGVIYSNTATVSLTIEEENRYMVFFTDKNGTPHEVETPLTFLSQRAIDRREAQNISVTEEDFPVAPAYIQSLRDAGIKVLYKTKWMNGVMVECTGTVAANLTSFPFVSAVEFTAPGGRPPVNGRIRGSAKFNEVSSATSATDTQISMLGMDQMHANGFRGEGILIAVMDSGFPGADTISYFRHVFNEGRFHSDASYDFVFGVQNVFDHYTETLQQHGTHVWSTIAAYKMNGFIGGAYKADFVLFVTEDTPSEYRVEEYNWLFAAERADSLGVDVISTSLGYNTFNDSGMNYTTAQMDGETAVITRASAKAAGKGMAVVVSAGNEGGSGWNIVTAPADGNSVLAVGAVNSGGDKASFSSVGPSADGRIKPDVAALGVSVSVVKADGTLGSANGTSFAGPLTASLVAGYWQKLRNLTAQQLLDTIRRRGNQFDSPDNRLGYGIPSFYSEVITSVDPQTEDIVTIYPNPVSNDFWIEFRDNRNPDFKLALIDAQGSVQVLQPSQWESQKFRVDMTRQKPGIYLVKLNRGNKVFTYKILKSD